MAQKLRTAKVSRNYTHNGENKTKWTSVGSLIETTKGGIMLILDVMPLPNAEGQIIIHFFKDEPKPAVVAVVAETEEAPF